MENKVKKFIKKNKNGLSVEINSVCKQIAADSQNWTAKLTSLDISFRNISDLDDSVSLPPHLTDLNLSHNNLNNVPKVVLKLEKIRLLDVSFNDIVNFDETPSFCHTVKYLNASNNQLESPPCWIWSELPSNLSELNLSCNLKLSNSIQNGEFKEFLQVVTLVSDVKIYNCRLKENIELLGTFANAKVLEVGTPDLSNYSSNRLIDLPCLGLNRCCDIQRLNVSNTCLYNINTNIDMYKYLIEINLSQNNIRDIPKEFCNLENLETCILSQNRIYFLPDDILKLKNLIRLHIDSNEIYILPENIWELPHLKTLDLYNNSLYEVPEEIMIEICELDLAQNYLEEPRNEEYLEKREKLRLNLVDRLEGRKVEVVRPESLHSPSLTDDEELVQLTNFGKEAPVESCDLEEDRPSSIEDWDSDEYWVPRYYHFDTPTAETRWLYFVKKKMEDGNFCPMDAHPISVAEKIKYEKLYNPQEEYESEGQFDDYTDDDS